MSTTSTAAAVNGSNGHAGSNGRPTCLVSAISTFPGLTPLTQAARFLKALFQPEDLILFRPIETWNEAGKKKSRVDYKGVAYRRFGLRPATGEPWQWFHRGLESFLTTASSRADSEKSNTFFGVCPRLGSDGRFDQAWQIRLCPVLLGD